MLKSREVILAKIETTYNIDPGLAAADDAILVENPSWSYEGAKMYARAPVRPSLAPLKPLFGGSLMTVTFDVEVKGSGTAGTAPELGTLLRMCAMGETIVGATSVTYAPVSTAHESGTIYYYSDGKLHILTGCKGTFSANFETGGCGKLSFTFTGHTKMRGTAASATSTTIVLPSTFSAVDDAYNGRTIKINSGTGAGQSKTIADYTGSSKTVTVTSWSVTPDNTSVFEIDGGEIDKALVTPTYDSTVPVTLVAVPFSIDSYGAVVSKIAFDMGNTVAQPPDISSPDGFGQLQITARKVSGSFDPEQVLVATKDFLAQWKANTAMALDTGVIGTTAGNRYRLQMPAVSYQSASKGDRDGISTFEMAFQAAETTTDNELSLAFT